MAKANAKCTCAKCGEYFYKTAIKRNCEEAERWEEWAVKNFTICGNCWHQEQLEQQKADGLWFVVKSIGHVGENDIDKHIAIVFGGDTMPYKDEIKALGARWTSEYPCIDESKKWAFENRWVLWCSVDNVKNAISQAESIGAVCKETLPDERIEALKTAVNNRIAMMAEESDQLKKEFDSFGQFPAFEDSIQKIFDAGKWNGRFYGKSGSFRIYISGLEVKISDEQKKSIEATLEARREWLEAKKEIEKTT